jgi:predicted TIM-barrel fold metal-dependent hydrolase
VTVIDAHVHLYPPEAGRDPAAWAAAVGESHWSVLCARRRKDGRAVQLFPTVAGLLRAMDAAGIGKSVLLGWYWEKPETCAGQNRFYAECVRAHPDRLAAFATICPATGSEPLDEMRRARDDGLIGLGELSPHAQHIALDDPSFRAVIQCAGELRWPVNLHVTDPDSAPYPGRVATPRGDFVRLANEHPQSTFILAHWGGGLAFDPASRSLKNLYFDSAASPLMYGTEVWSRAVNAVGADRLLFGSDNPLRLYPQVEADVGLASFVREASQALPAADQPAILAGNARRLLGL